MSKRLSAETLEAPEQTYRVSQIAEATQQSEESVLREIYEGRLKAVNIGRGAQRPRWRITASEYGAYLVRLLHRA